MEIYRGYELTSASIVGGSINIAKGGEFVDRVLGGMAEARSAVDEILAEAGS